MAVVTANVDSLAAQAAAVPGSDPATLQRIMSLAKDINAAYSRTDGMNMTAVTTGAGKLLGSGGRSRGGIGGFIYKFLVDIASKIGSDGAFRWFQSIGVSDDEEQRESAETRQRDNALKLHEEVEAACRSIEEIDATANTAIGGLMETISMLLGIVRLHPAGRAAALIMPLVANGFEQVYGIVEDRNQQLEACLNAVAESGRAMQEHQPAPPCEWTCPPASETPCSDAPAPQQPVDAPAPPAQGGTVAASSEDECDEKPTPAAQPAQPTQPAQCAPPAPSEPPAEKCIERLVPAPPLDRMPTHAASAVTESPTNIAFNFHIDSDATWQASSACAPTCDDAAQFAPPKQDFSVCHIGVLA